MDGRMDYLVPFRIFFPLLRYFFSWEFLSAMYRFFLSSLPTATKKGVNKPIGDPLSCNVCVYTTQHDVARNDISDLPFTIKKEDSKNRPFSQITLWKHDFGFFQFRMYWIFKKPFLLCRMSVSFLPHCIGWYNIQTAVDKHLSFLSLSPRSFSLSPLFPPQLLYLDPKNPIVSEDERGGVSLRDKKKLFPLVISIHDSDIRTLTLAAIVYWAKREKEKTTVSFCLVSTREDRVVLYSTDKF